MSEVLEQVKDELEVPSDVTTSPETSTTETTPEDDLTSWLDGLGGREIVTEAKSVYDLYTDPKSFDSNKFWLKLAELSESRYNAAMVDAYTKHPDAAVYFALGLKSQDDLVKIKEFVKNGMQSPATSKEDGMSDAELAAIDEPWAKELLESRQFRREQNKAIQEAREQENQRQYLEVQREIAANHSRFDASHEEAVDRELAKLQLGDDQLAKDAKDAIKALAFYYFYNTKTSANIYATATDHIKNREHRLGFQLLPQVVNWQNKHTAKAIQFISDLLQPKRAEGSLKRNEAQKVINPPAGGAAAPPIASQPGASGNVAYFDQKAQLAKLRELKAQRG